MRKSPQSKDFVLDCFSQTSKLQNYESLYDRNLRGYFTNKRMIKHLIKTGLLSKDGEVLSKKSKKIWEVPQMSSHFAVTMAQQAKLELQNLRKTDFTQNKQLNSELLQELSSSSNKMGEQNSPRNEKPQKQKRSFSQKPKFESRMQEIQPMPANEYQNLLNEYKMKVVNKQQQSTKQEKDQESKQNQNKAKEFSESQSKQATETEKKEETKQKEESK